MRLMTARQKAGHHARKSISMTSLQRVLYMPQINQPKITIISIFLISLSLDWQNLC